MEHNKWSTSEETLLKELTTQGVSTREIAQRLGRSTTAVYQRRQAIKNREEVARMQKKRKEIPRDVYERSLKHRCHIAESDTSRVFTADEIYGYGVYSTHTYEEDGKCYVEYSVGDSCD